MRSGRQMRAPTSFMVSFNVIRHGSKQSMPTATPSALPRPSLRGEDPLRIAGMGAGATPCVIDQIVSL